MKRADTYITLKHKEISLSALDADERAVVDELTELQRRESSWPAFHNLWLGKVSKFYEARGLSRRDVIATPVWQIAQDLGSRLMVRAGIARAPDYRDRLEEMIRSGFPSRRAFCDATGISEDMLSHVLARRKHLAVDTLSEALGRIGFELQIVPISE